MAYAKNYAPGGWQNDIIGATPIAAANLNQLETQYDEAITEMDSRFIIAETQVYNANAPIAWTDLDLNATIGAQATLVMLKLSGAAIDAHSFAFRKNGDADEFYVASTSPAGVANFRGANGIHFAVLVATDAGGVIEWIGQAADAVTIDVMAYIK